MPKGKRLKMGQTQSQSISSGEREKHGVSVKLEGENPVHPCPSPPNRSMSSETRVWGGGGWTGSSRRAVKK